MRTVVVGDMAGVRTERRTGGGEENIVNRTAYIAGVLTSIQEIVNALVLPQGREVQVIHQCVQAILEGGRKNEMQKNVTMNSLQSPCDCWQTSLDKHCCLGSGFGYTGKPGFYLMFVLAIGYLEAPATPNQCQRTSPGRSQTVALASRRQCLDLITTQRLQPMSKCPCIESLCLNSQF